MYRCELCGVVVQTNNPCIKLVVESRRKVYTERRESNRIRIQGKKKPLHVGDPGGVGWEIVREVKVCRTCNEKWLEEHEGQPMVAEPEVTLATVMEAVVAEAPAEVEAEVAAE